MTAPSRRIRRAAHRSGSAIPSVALTIAKLSADSVQVSWTTATNPMAGWTIGRDGTDSTGYGSWTSSALPGTTRQQTFTNLLTSSIYTFTLTDLDTNRVHRRAYDMASGSINVITNFTKTAATDTSITLGWSYNGATLSSYTLSYGSTTRTIAAGQTSYTDNDNLIAGTTRSYTLVGNLTGGGVTATASYTGSTTGGAAGAYVFPLRVSSNNRYLEDANARPFLVMAETSWTMLSKLSIADCKWIIDTRKYQGFNTIMTNLEAFDPGSYGPRGGAFPGGDLTQWNESYFVGVDEILQYAGQQGIHIMLNAFWMGNYWFSGRMPSDQVASALGDKVGRRYRSYANVSYFVGGDRYYSMIANATNAYGSALRAAAPDRLITFHSGGGTVDIYPSTSQIPWMNFRSAQLSGRDTAINDALSGYRTAQPTLPAWCIEPPYEPDGWEQDHRNPDTSPLMHRQNLWGAFLAGAFGVAYGGPHDVWYAGFGGQDTASSYGPLYKAGYDREAAWATGHVGKILAPYAWHMLVPNNSVVGGNGGRTGAHAGVSPDRSLLVAYAQGDITFDGSALRGTCTCQWYSPVTGLAVGGAFSKPNSPNQYCQSPVGGDGVLVITA